MTDDIPADKRTTAIDVRPLKGRAAPEGVGKATFVAPCCGGSARLVLGNGRKAAGPAVRQCRARPETDAIVVRVMNETDRPPPDWFMLAQLLFSHR